MFLSYNITEKHLLAGIAWITSPIMKSPRYARIFDGIIGLELERGIVPGLQDYISRQVTEILKYYSDRAKVLGSLCNVSQKTPKGNFEWF